jgi:hypothetical protein
MKTKNTSDQSRSGTTRSRTFGVLTGNEKTRRAAETPVKVAKPALSFARRTESALSPFGGDRLGKRAGVYAR